MDMTYRILGKGEIADLCARLAAEGVATYLALIDDAEKAEQFLTIDMSRDDVLCLGGFVDGELAGAMTVMPFGDVTQIGEVGCTALRKWFPVAARLFRGACLWCFEHLDMVSMIGRVPCSNRAAKRLFAACGFDELCRMEGMFYSWRKEEFIPGWLVMATPDSIREAEGNDMSFGGTPHVEKAPEKQQTKSLSAGATAAAEAQREKARRNRGLTSAIIADRTSFGSGDLRSNVEGSQTLGG